MKPPSTVMSLGLLSLYGPVRIAWGGERCRPLFRKHCSCAKVAFALKDSYGVDVPVIALLSELELGELVGFIRGEHSLESLQPMEWDSEAAIDEGLTSSSSRMNASVKCYSRAQPVMSALRSWRRCCKNLTTFDLSVA